MTRRETVLQGPQCLQEGLLQDLLHVGRSQDTPYRSRQTISVFPEQVRQVLAVWALWAAVARHLPLSPGKTLPVAMGFGGGSFF